MKNKSFNDIFKKKIITVFFETKLSRFGYCPASEEHRPRFGYSSAEEQAMFTGQYPASRKVQNMSTDHDSFGFFLPSSL